MPIAPVTKESLERLRSDLSKARKDLTKFMNDHDEVERDLKISKNSLFLDYALKRNGLKFEGTNDKIREAELEEILLGRPDYQEKTTRLEYLKRQKREAADHVSDLETQLKTDLSTFEDERAKANRAILAEVLQSEVSHPTPIKTKSVEVAVDTARESVQARFYDDLG